MGIRYSEIFSKAWTITWKYKVLWFFGFLAMLGGNGAFNSPAGGNPSPRFSANYGAEEINRRYIPPDWTSTIEQMEKVDVNTWISIAVIAGCGLLLLGLACWLISILGRGGLISGILAADTTGKLTFREAWDAGVRYWLKLFVIRLLGILVSLLVAILIFLPGAFIGLITCGIGFIPVACFLFVLGIVVNLWFAFMDYAIVVENLGLGEAIGRAWTVLRNHIGPALVFWLLLFAASLVVGIGMLILLLPSAVFIVLAFLPLFTGIGVFNPTMLVIGLVLLALFILVSIVVKSVYTVWETGVMTLAYREFGKRTPLLAVAAAPQQVVSA